MGEPSSREHGQKNWKGQQGTEGSRVAEKLVNGPGEKAQTPLLNDKNRASTSHGVGPAKVLRAGGKGQPRVVAVQT